MRYRIVAYGPGKECLTWADDANLVQIKQRLRGAGYNEIVEEIDDDMRFHGPHPRNPLVDGWICPYCGKRVYSTKVHSCNQPYC